MRASLTTLLGALAVAASAAAVPASLEARQSSLDNTRFNAMLRNIAGASSNTLVPGAASGSVLASPSTDSPNYYYSWLRDSSLTFKVIIDAYIKGQHGVTRALIERWIQSEQVNQANARSSSSSLGEPKFNSDGSLFTGPWGRPQNDGPALRATAIMRYARAIGLSDSYTATLYKPDLSAQSIIKSDLEYVAHHWQDSSFDLWEEVQNTHLFTLMVQRRALVEGAAFATDMKDPDAAAYYAQQAAAIGAKLPSFYDPGVGRVQAYYNVDGRSGIDSAAILGFLHAFNQTAGAGTDCGSFGVACDRVLATHKQYTDAFRSLYQINSGKNAPAAAAVGRYPEDVYDGVGTSKGRPWFLTTSAAAELLYDAANVFDKVGSLAVTSISKAFFAQFQSSVAVGTYNKGSSTYGSLTGGMRTMADGFMQIVEAHSFNNGSLSEEFDASTGYSRGARDLTWSYAAYLTASAARAGTPAF